MASNRLVANASKTTLLFINLKSNQQQKIKIGQTEVVQESSAKLLGMNVTDDLEWKKHIEIIISSLNKRYFLISRMKNKLNSKSLIRIADGIYNSKLRYGIQLCSKIRWQNKDPLPGFMEDLQKAQNKIFRLLNNSRISDKIETKAIMKNLKMLSANQINAQVKLVEMWKSTNVPNYPIQCDKKDISQGDRVTRAAVRGDLIVKGTSTKGQASFINDASRAWNKAPDSIKKCKKILSAK